MEFDHISQQDRSSNVTVDRSNTRTLSLSNVYNKRNIQLFLATWNVGNAQPENMERLFPDKNNGDEDYDIYVIGLQESTFTLSGNNDSNDQVLPDGTVNPSNKKKSDENSIKYMETKIMSILGDEFKIVKHNHRAQLQLYVIAKKSIYNHISIVEMNAENTGFMHVFPNKGGLLVAMNIDSTSLAFVSCHLAAHEGVAKCQLRNDSIKEILYGARVRNKKIDILAQFHHVFWMGDMNYRLTFDKATPVEAQLSTNRSLAVKSNINSLQTSQTSVPSTITIQELSNRSNKSDDQSSVKYTSVRNSVDALDNELTIDVNFDGNNLYSSNMDNNVDGNNIDDDDENNAPFTSKSNNRVVEMNKIYKLISDENWSELLKLDELNREIAAGRVLEGFTALQPNFPPTFKRIRHQVIRRTDATIELENNFHSLDLQLDDIFAIGNNESMSKQKQWNIHYIENFPDFRGTSKEKDTKDKDSKDKDSKDKDSKEIKEVYPSLTGASLKETVLKDSTISSTLSKSSDTITISTQTSDSSIFNSTMMNDVVQNFYDKKRLPSYTDRILYKSWHGFAKNLEVKQFGSKESVTSSDHKPVYAVFQLTTTGGLDSIRQFHDSRIFPRFPLTSNSSSTFNIKSPSIDSSEDPNKRASLGRHASTSTTSSNSRNVEKLTIILSNVVGHNLAEMDSALSGGKSDPYIVITTDPKELLKSYSYNTSNIFNCSCIGKNNKNNYSYRSETIYHNINPKWKDDMRLVLRSTDILNLKDNLHFIFTVWDEDRYNNDDVIGSFTVAFADMLVYFNEKKPYEFRHKLLNAGIQMGVLSGKFTLQGDVNEILVHNDTAVPSLLKDNLANMESTDQNNSCTMS